MKGYAFYLEYADRKAKRKATRKALGEHRGTVVAVPLPREWYRDGSDVMSAVSGVFDSPNSPVCYGSASASYLAERCKRISEAQAREIHPELFTYLNN